MSRAVQVVSMTGPLEAAITVGPHSLLADEPVEEGGADAGPNPFEYLAASLGSCTVLTLKLYAKRKAWPLTGVSTEVTAEKIGEVHQMNRKISLEGPLDADQRQRLLEIANKCPIHRTLVGKIEITTSLI